MGLHTRSYSSGVAALRLTVTASRPAAARAAGTSRPGLSSCAVTVRVEPAADAPQPQPLGDGEHHVEPHGGLAEAAEDDLVGRSVQEATSMAV